VNVIYIGDIVMATYIALIRKDKDSVFGVEFPDFPGCISAGDTLDKAVAGAKEALELHVKGMLEDGDEIPNPSGLEVVRRRPEIKGTVPVLVDVPVVRRNKRVNITMDEGLLEKVDELSAALGTTRSGFLAIAARKSLLEAQKREGLE
jgi:predicted RNase H-like HicB family nuclease